MKYPALVGIVPRKNLWEIIKNEKWYHIPVSANSAPKKPESIKYIAFYFPEVFGEDGYKVIWYAEVLSFEIKKRIELFSNEPENKRANEDYLQFHLTKIQKLPNVIFSKRKRKDITHISTNTEKLFSAKEINDLCWEDSPLEDKMHEEFKRRGIEAERQWFVEVKDHKYFLDFAALVGNKKIDIECDSRQFHSSQEAIKKDKERDIFLKSAGWQVLRFTGDEIIKNIDNCFQIIEKTIR